LLVAAVAVLTLTASACGGGGGGGGKGVSATLSEWQIKLDPSSAGNGQVTFNISNQGANVHEFVVFKTDLAPDALPTKTVEGSTEVDEEASGLTLVDEKEDIAPGSSVDLTVNLEPGSYVVICNIAGHYEKGMHAAFTVS
jgi:uncharacterized cupredoxin-like copper-binding protein